METMHSRANRQQGVVQMYAGVMSGVSSVDEEMSNNGWPSQRWWLITNVDLCPSRILRGIHRCWSDSKPF